METKDMLKILVIVLLLLGIFSLGYLYFIKPKIIEVCPNDNLSLLDVDIYTLAENLYDSSEMFYDYYVYNYGNAEAKNIKVTCKSWDKNMNLQFSLTDNFGNIGSKSGKPGEVIGDNKIIAMEEYVSDCYISSCENCKILYKEIPELVEYLEK